MGADDPFGIPGRARGVDQQGRSVLRGRCTTGAGRGTDARKIGEVDDPSASGEGGTGRTVGDDDSRIAVVDDVVDLHSRETRVQRDEHGTEFQHRPHEDDGSDARPGESDDAVTRADTEIGELIGRCGDPRPQFRPAEPFRAIAHGGPVGAVPHGVPEEFLDDHDHAFRVRSRGVVTHMTDDEGSRRRARPLSVLPGGAATIIPGSSDSIVSMHRSQRTGAVI